MTSTIKLPGLARSRQRDGISRVALAKKARVSSCTVYSVEVAAKTVRPVTAQKLATALGVSLATLRTR